ncbi:hypothetical protein A6C57_25820 [Fibrella sp. ES10-3-2-2]
MFRPEPTSLSAAFIAYYSIFMSELMNAFDKFSYPAQYTTDGKSMI